tara:strand:+ start:327 stop:1067 length:741 start_codon:yes stop_codon:yes gene_type:complete
LATRIRAFFEASRRTYGSPRILLDLQEAGDRVGRRRVMRLMRQEKLCAHLSRRFRKTTDSAHDAKVAPNTVDRDFSPIAANKLWAVDISYVRTWSGWVYLAVVIDLYSRRVVGWSLADHMRTELPLNALKSAIALRHPGKGLVQHSDRGSQYCSHDYQKFLEENGMECSMSRRANCWDNSCVESFFATIKKELIYRHSWPTESAVRAAIAQYVDFYNARRRHSTIGNCSPIEYELALATDDFKMAA